MSKIIPIEEPPLIANNANQLKAIIDNTIQYMEGDPSFEQMCRYDAYSTNNLSNGMCQFKTVEDIITKESVQPITNAVINKGGSGLSNAQIASAVKEGTIKASKEIVHEYTNLPNDLENALTAVFGFASNIITDPRETMNNAIAGYNEAEALIVMLADEATEVAGALPSIVSSMSAYDKVMYTTYISIHLAHELAPTSKLKLLKLTKLRRPRWLASSKILLLSIRAGNRIKFSYLKHLTGNDFKVFGRILTNKYKNNPLTRSEHVLLNLISKNQKSEYRPYLINMWKGNVFNDLRKRFFDANEIYIDSSKMRNGKKVYYRLDSYNTRRSPKGIFSRKDTQLSQHPKDAIKHLDEMTEKYPRGAKIANVPSSREKGLSGDLMGQMYLEVPVQNGKIPDRILNYASEKDILIRDIKGKIYNEL